MKQRIKTKKAYHSMTEKLLYLLFLCSFVTGCLEDSNMTKITYMPDMADGPIVKAHREYLDPPEGSVARNAIIYPDTPEEAGELLSNPFAAVANQEKVLKDGKRLYGYICITCHGPHAKGKGKISDKFPPAPDLTTDLYKNKEDGYIYHRITFGSAIMPGYGHALSSDERWKVVSYLRTLQENKSL